MNRLSVQTNSQLRRTLPSFLRRSVNRCATFSGWATAIRPPLSDRSQMMHCIGREYWPSQTTAARRIGRRLDFRSSRRCGSILATCPNIEHTPAGWLPTLLKKMVDADYPRKAGLFLQASRRQLLLALPSSVKRVDEGYAFDVALVSLVSERNSRQPSARAAATVAASQQDRTRSYR